MSGFSTELKRRNVLRANAPHAGPVHSYPSHRR